MIFQKCLTRDQTVRPGIEELLNHPYLISEKKDGTFFVSYEQFLAHLAIGHVSFCHG